MYKRLSRDKRHYKNTIYPPYDAQIGKLWGHEDEEQVGKRRGGGGAPGVMWGEREASPFPSLPMRCPTQPSLVSPRVKQRRRQRPKMATPR